jgi:hypothetical protein
MIRCHWDECPIEKLIVKATPIGKVGIDARFFSGRAAPGRRLSGKDRE